MEPCAAFVKVPVVDVHRDNFLRHKAAMEAAMAAASFIAIDCELSGLGERKKLNAPTIDERYRNTGLVAKTRSIISLGLSTYRLLPNDDEKSHHWSYLVQTFNIMVLCGEDYIVEPGSLRFLVEHGFDFDKQYSLGVSYLRGNDRATATEPSHLRDLFSALVSARKAIVVHNGLIDLIFLYHNLWAALPDKLGTFVSDLTEMFPAGIYDTKYIADYVSRTQASYLEFIFRKEQKTNLEKSEKGRPHVRIGFETLQDSTEDLEWRHCGHETSETNGEPLDGSSVCFSYAHHGHCPEGNNCPLSHDIDLILRQKTIEKEKKRRKRKGAKNDSAAATPPEKEPQLSDDTPPADMGTRNGAAATAEASPAVNSGGHRAGYDAFMTGFAFATFLVHQTKLPLNPGPQFMAAAIRAEQLVNRIYLVAKDFPLLVQRSAFARCSGEHDAKMRRLGLLQEEEGETGDSK